MCVRFQPPFEVASKTHGQNHCVKNGLMRKGQKRMSSDNSYGRGNVRLEPYTLIRSGYENVTVTPFTGKTISAAR